MKKICKNCMYVEPNDDMGFYSCSIRLRKGDAVYEEVYCISCKRFKKQEKLNEFDLIIL